MDIRFDGQVALISGAASGMGLLFSKNFAALGGSIVMCDINPETLSLAVKEIHAIRAGAAIGVPCDVRDYAQVVHARDEAMRVYGRIDVVIPFAGGAETRMLGISGKLEFPDIPIEVFDWSLDVNLRGQIYFAHAAMGVMRDQKSGVVICIGSITGEEGSANNVGYAATKSAAMNGLVKSLAEFGGAYGIRACCVAPGPVMTRAAMANMATLMGRAADPQEIIDLILYLASDKAAFITGITVLADGGRNVMKKKTYRKFAEESK
jgi:NAD(P)-dependent dehydrogenase (short-subunit alcohol dehydrogenase family)